jgi:hypothetical protein
MPEKDIGRCFVDPTFRLNLSLFGQADKNRDEQQEC